MGLRGFGFSVGSRIALGLGLGPLQERNYQGETYLIVQDLVPKAETTPYGLHIDLLEASLSLAPHFKLVGVFSGLPARARGRSHASSDHRPQYHPQLYTPHSQTRTKQAVSKGYPELSWAFFLGGRVLYG